MTPQQISLVQSSFKSVAPIASKAADLFYDHLFVIAPEVRQLFPVKLSEQKIKLMAMLTKTVNNLHQLDAILPAVRQLGERHRGYVGISGLAADARSTRMTRSGHAAPPPLRPGHRISA